MAMLTAATMDRETAGDNEAKALMRILTPLIKLRACRDNIRVATGSMEVRGGNGYIEEWVNARLVRDATDRQGDRCGPVGTGGRHVVHATPDLRPA